MKVESILKELHGKSYEEVIASISVIEDGADCCGWAEVTVSDALSAIKDSGKSSLREVIRIDYDFDEMGDFGRSVVNFIFDIGDSVGVILGYVLTASSGSGWSYGAFCELVYNGESIARAEY